MAVHEAPAPSDPNDEGKGMRSMFGPHSVDQAIRQGISVCWMTLPNDRRNPENVAVEIRRIVERALANMKEDAEAFGFSREEE